MLRSIGKRSRESVPVLKKGYGGKDSGFVLSVAEWLACWTQGQNGPGSNRSRDAVG